MITDIMKIQSITIGKRGENNAVALEFDMSEFTTKYSSGTPVIVHQRPGETRPYVVQGTSYDTNSNVLTWTVRNEDVGIAGTGYAEIRWTVSGKIAKSARFETIITDALSDSTTETPGSVVYMVKGVGDLMKSVTNLGVTEGPDGAIEIFGNGIKGATISVSDTSGAYIYKIVTGPVMINAGRVNSITIPSGSSYVDASITFSDEFGEAPYLQVTGKSSSTNINTVPVPIVLSTTKTGASVRVWRNGSDTSAAAYPQLWWMAIGKA